MSSNPFVLPAEQYKRDINVLGHYQRDAALYVSKMTGRPVEECLEFVKRSVGPGGQFEFKDPDILFLERGENGDRFKKTGKLSEYLGDAVKNQRLIAPTLTTYTNPKVNQSLLVDYIDGNVKARGVLKKAMFSAKMAGDELKETIYKIGQTNKKLSNNSISGAHVSASTPLYNKTAHSTLTSNCRSTSGYGNANNEKFLCGNRHYWNPDIVRNNIISIINNSDYLAMAQAMKRWGIRYPSVEDTMACIEYSTRLYWHSTEQTNRLRALVETLTEPERAAFVYTGDLYHLRKFNDGVVRAFIGRLSSRVEAIHPDPKSVMDDTIEEYHQLATQICSREMKGKTIRDVASTPVYGVLGSTVANIRDTILDYGDLIRAFWVTPNVPASVAYFPDSIRHAAVTSDTDSTIFTVQDWVEWQTGAITFDEQANAVAATMIFLAAQGIIHVLARMSANFGIEQKRLHQIAMKNEFKFDVFVPTQVAKHYFALIGCQEGNLFKEYEKEIKGVHLKSSNAPKAILKQATKMMEDIMNAVIQGEKLSISAILKQVADIERGVVESVRSGNPEYFRRGQIKISESYTKSAEESPYSHYLMWKEVFAPKYGDIQEPPYSCLKFSTELDSPTKTKLWLAQMEDRELAGRMEAWLLKYKGGVGSMTTFQLPEQVLTATGVPKEIMEVVGVRKIVLDTTTIFYIILETLGYYCLNDRMSRLCMDVY